MTAATASFADRLLAAGFNFFTGVPDSTFKALFAQLETRPEFWYVPAVSENVAIGTATGASQVRPEVASSADDSTMPVGTATVVQTVFAHKMYDDGVTLY